MSKIKFICPPLICFIIAISVQAWALEIKSSAFSEGEEINSQYTCDGDDTSPALNWGGVPAGTKSLALICEDPDSPSKVWSHWVVFNMPADKAGFAEGVAKTGTLSDGTVQGVNNFGRVGYNGPCPPPNGVHRYFFKLYALDTNLLLDKTSTREALLEAIQGHVIGEAQTHCTYQRM